MPAVWKEVTATTNPLDGIWGDCVMDFRKVCPSLGGINDPLTRRMLQDRVKESIDARKPTPAVATELRMFRLWRYYDASDVGMISLALDRTLQRISDAAAKRDHWCISLGLSEECTSTMKAPGIYAEVKIKLKSILDENPKPKLALMWRATQADPLDELGSVTSPTDAPTVNNVFRSMLIDAKLKPPGIKFKTDPENAPAERAYAHFEKHLKMLYPSQGDHYVRFVEIVNIH